MIWERREIENYLCSESTLVEYARESAEEDTPGPLFAAHEADRRDIAMREAIEDVQHAMQTLGTGSPWSVDTKVSDHFLTPLFNRFFEKLALPNVLQKKSFYELAKHVPTKEIDEEIREKLEVIAQVARSASPGNSSDGIGA